MRRSARRSEIPWQLAPSSQLMHVMGITNIICHTDLRQIIPAFFATSCGKSTLIEFQMLKGPRVTRADDEAVWREIQQAMFFLAFTAYECPACEHSTAIRRGNSTHIESYYVGFQFLSRGTRQPPSRSGSGSLRTSFDSHLHSWHFGYFRLDKPVFVQSQLD